MSLLEILADLKETALQLRRIADTLECVLAVEVHGEAALRHLRKNWRPGEMVPAFPKRQQRTERPDGRRLTQPTDEDLWEIERQSQANRELVATEDSE